MHPKQGSILGLGGRSGGGGKLELEPKPKPFSTDFKEPKPEEVLHKSQEPPKPGSGSA